MRLSLLQKLDEAHEDSVWTVTWIPGSKKLVTGSVDETAKVWEEVDDTLQERHVFVRFCYLFLYLFMRIRTCICIVFLCTCCRHRHHH